MQNGTTSTIEQSWERNEINDIIDNLDIFRAGLPVSKGVLQRLDATWLGHQAITHHLGGEYPRTTDYSANTVRSIIIHAVSVLSWDV